MRFRKKKNKFSFKSQCSGGNKAEGLEMSLLLSNLEQNLETSGGHLRDVTWQVTLSWMRWQQVHPSSGSSAPCAAPLTLKHGTASGFLPHRQKNAPPLSSTSFDRHRLTLVTLLLADKKPPVLLRTGCNSPAPHYSLLLGLRKRRCKILRKRWGSRFIQADFCYLFAFGSGFIGSLGKSHKSSVLLKDAEKIPTAAERRERRRPEEKANTPINEELELSVRRVKRRSLAH